MERENICREVKVLSTLIRQKIMAPQEIKKGKILGGHGYFLRFIAENYDKEIFQRDLEKTFKIRRSTVTATINRMEKEGLIERKQVDYDSRLKKLEITPKGLEVHNACKKRVFELETKIAEALTEKEAETFIKLIKKLKEKAEQID